MKLQFSNDLQYQIDAVNAVADLFGVLGEGVGGATVGRPAFGLRSEGMVIANELEFNESQVLRAVQEKQKEWGIEEKSLVLGSLDFSIEMETGTGKTYVYLRTIMELNKRYGLTKFIILVPSVAIREGVLKTLEQTQRHFSDMYGVSYGYFAYDSAHISKVRNDFAGSPDMQIMVMTVQSFNKDANILRQDDRDNTHGVRYLDLIASTRPVVIMDEPQNMGSDLAKASIDELGALFKLRYSATHKEKHNLVYRLSPADAYKNGLVKKIEVFGVVEDDPSAFVFQVKEIIAKKNSLPKARVTLEIKRKDGEFVIEEKLISGGEDLFVKSAKNEKYAGMVVSEIHAGNGIVELSNGTKYVVEAPKENKEEIFRTQIRETIKSHFRKQEKFGTQMKVLSLLFIDRVDNYVHEDSLIRAIFEEEYAKLTSTSERFKDLPPSSVHEGYFAKKVTKKGIEYKDTRGESKEDKDAYNLIMKDKERLLSLNESVSFIFSHSALKEGWDNPNIFQICTLNETRSGDKKRQEIGRGLRLPVDCNGVRIYDEQVNVLTVIPNESYREFAGTLQKEYTEAGHTNSPAPSNARERVKVSFKKHLSTDSEDFKELWSRIAKKTKFKLELNTKELITQSIELVNEIPARAVGIQIERGRLVVDDNGGLMQVREGDAYGERLERNIKLEDVVGRIVREVNITRQTAYKILTGSENFGQLWTNPEYFVRNTISCIRNIFDEMLVNEGLQYYPVEDVWEVDFIFDNFESYTAKVLENKGGKSVYNHVAFDSDGEMEFAKRLQESGNVKLFAKLPKKFVVDTPLGSYNPDWAIVWDSPDIGQKLYLVRETKFMNDLNNLRAIEQKKIMCGEKHFAAIGVDFKAVKKEDLGDLIN